MGVVGGGIYEGVDEDGGDGEEGVVGGVGVGVDGEEAELGGEGGSGSGTRRY